PRHREQRCAASIDCAVYDEPDIAGNGVGQLVEGIIFPPFRFDHVISLYRYRGAGCAYPNHPATACPLRFTAGRKRRRSCTMLHSWPSITPTPVPRSTVHSLT